MSRTIRPSPAALVLVGATIWAVPEPLAQSSQQPAGTVLATKEITLASLPAEADLQDWSVSPDGARIAYVAKHGKSRAVVVDGKAGPLWDDVSRDSLDFSPDSRHFAYVAKQRDRWHAIIDGSASKPWDEVGGKHVAWSPDSQRVGYCARTGKSWRAVLDGVEGPSREEPLKGPIFSDDGSRIAFLAGSVPSFGWARKTRVIVDGLEGPSYVMIYGFWFSPDSRRVAFSASRDHNDVTVIDGVEGPEFDFFSLAFHEARVLFSPDSRRTAYVGEKSHHSVLVVDGKVERTADGGFGRLAFSGDSRRFGYWFALRHKWWQLTKDPRGEVRIVIDGVEGPVYRGAADGPVFSRDGTRVAYAGVQENGNVVVVVDGQERESYGHYGAGSLMFSADGRHLAYFAGREGKWSLVLDGVEGKPYSAIPERPIAFTRDGQHVLYVAKDGNGVRVVVDFGRESGQYDAIGPVPGLTGPHSFYVIAIRGREILRVEIDVTGGDQDLRAMT